LSCPSFCEAALAGRFPLVVTEKDLPLLLPDFFCRVKEISFLYPSDQIETVFGCEAPAIPGSVRPTDQIADGVPKPIDIDEI
jgi:hypothetical protein